MCIYIILYTCRLDSAASLCMQQALVCKPNESCLDIVHKHMLNGCSVLEFRCTV